MQYENSCMHLMTVTIYNFAKDSNTLHIYADWLHVAFFFFNVSTATQLPFFVFSCRFFLGFFSFFTLAAKFKEPVHTDVCRCQSFEFYKWDGRKKKKRKKKKSMGFRKKKGKKRCFQKCVRLHRETRAMPQLEVCKRSTYIHNTERGVT